MIYKPSKALDTFDSDIQPILNRLDSLKNQQDIISEYKDDILFSSIFLSHAYFENYIDDIFSSYTKSFANFKLIDLPDYLKAFYFYKAIPDKVHKLAVGFENEETTLATLQSTLRNPNQLLNLHATLPQYALKGDFLYERKKYPSVDNLNIIYKRIGIKKIFNEVSRELKSDAQSYLESLSSLRTTLAHNGELVGISFDDVILSLEKFIKFVEGLDKVLHKHLLRELGDAFWNIEISS
ncbi:HEPN domain-containing protein [Acinetobacter baumannii]|jgi:hypothetical protein|uniref:HEPN domain-containing protein n=3 Tax=Acinetobacter calcoaceticus/baumannii complex TaxID=909768 RepID=UPI00077D0EC6|nr:HEPN domain-containing protein [Acinetobacter baumannii]EHU1527820.1 hypothetical protein [Acinetobacter baumannii]EHU2002644.1 hypothetical protein [Acinetobacter baumannii]MCQ8901106.1 HEPN domain-containing protein [Acinetobacter baumannii]MDC5554833.1 HEPN domain-containing protein [Acinetobacter baumannii]MDI9255766.1 HEPN domain-containing protein [Acinetobacter baumannii]